MENKKEKILYWSLFFLFLIISLILIIKIKLENSITTDEPFTILSSYSIVKEGKFDIQIETPPFLKILIGNAIKNLNLRGTPDPPVERLKDKGKNYLYFISENLSKEKKLNYYYFIPLIFLFVAFAVFMSYWFFKVGGFWGGMAGNFSILFSPFYLGHTLIAQSDFIISFGYAICLYFFLKSLKNHKFLIFFTLFFGITLSSKFSSLFLIPFLFLIFLMNCLKEKKFNFKFFILFSISIIFSFLTVILIYSYSIRNITKEDEKKIIELTLKEFPDSKNKIKLLKNISNFSKELSHFLLGITYLNLLNKNQSGISYIFGEKKIGGFWYYFPVSFLIKNPLSFLAIFFICLFYKKIDFFSFKILTIILLYFLISMASSYNYGIRHLSPIFPLISIFISKKLGEINCKKIFSTSFCFLIFIETILNYPNYISYFNFFFNKDPERFLIDSNLDWGQDWKRAAKFFEKNNIEGVILVYEGTFPYEKYFKDGKRFSDFLIIDENTAYSVSIHTKITAVEYYILLKNFEMANAYKNLFKILESDKFKKLKIEKSIEIYIPKCYNKI